MKAKIILISIALFLCVNVFSKTNKSKGLTGVYFTFYSDINSYKYTDFESTKTAGDYVTGNLNLFISLYKENFFEVNINFNTETYTDTIDDILFDFRRYGIGFEIGKVMSRAIFIKDKKVVTPDFSAGAFFKLIPVAENEYVESKIYSSYGLYFVFKLKFNQLLKSLKIKSLDLGFKYIMPVSNTYYEDDLKIISYYKMFFIGVSF